MIRFHKGSAWERLLRLIPFFKRRQDQRLRLAITALVENPNLPCEIEGVVIPNGWGS